MLCSQVNMSVHLRTENGPRHQCARTQRAWPEFCWISKALVRITRQSPFNDKSGRFAREGFLRRAQAAAKVEPSALGAGAGVAIPVCSASGTAYFKPSFRPDASRVTASRSRRAFVSRRFAESIQPTYACR